MRILILTLGTNQYRRNFYYQDSILGSYAISVQAAFRPDGMTCPEWSQTVAGVQWTESQQIIISSTSGTPPSSSGDNASLPPPSPIYNSGSPAYEVKRIHAFAGEDRTIVAGSNAEFSGSATGIDGKPLTNARFWWNFGNGEAKEGKTVNYAFLIPGRYTVGLHVSSGEYSASDYVIAEVVPNQFSVSGVLIGESGFVKIKNEGPVAVDIGNWILEDAAGKSFTVPLRTAIGSKSEIAFANSITGILVDGSAYLRVRYPNMSLAFVWEEKASVAVVKMPAVSVEAPASPPFQTFAQKNETTSVINEDTKSKEAVVQHPVQENLSKTASVASGTSAPSTLFFVAAVTLGLVAAVAFMLFRIVK